MPNEDLSAVVVPIPALGIRAKFWAWVVMLGGVGPDGKATPLSIGGGGQIGNPQGAANWGVSPKTAAADGTTTLVARATRRAVTVTNLSTSPETAWIGPATGVNASTGQALAAGESIVLDTTAAVFFFSTAGTATVTCLETWD